MKVSNVGEVEGISLEDALIQEASEHLAKVKFILTRLGMEELVSQVQKIKDELNSEVFIRLGEEVICIS